MRVLYHFPLDPASRQARIALSEAKLKFKLEAVNPWAPEEEFIKLCAEGTPPALSDVTSNGPILVVGARAICEYMNDTAPKSRLMPDDAVERAEARRLCDWLDMRFSDDVHSYILHERVEKVIFPTEPAHPPTLRAGREAMHRHFEYLTWLLEQRDYLAGRHFSLADVAGVAHLSCLDFIGEIRWRDWPEMRDWYQKLKSRPSVQPLLNDRLAGFLPPRHYRDLDF